MWCVITHAEFKTRFLKLYNKRLVNSTGATEELDLFWLHVFWEEHLEHFFFLIVNKSFCVYLQTCGAWYKYLNYLAHILISEMEIMPVLPGILKKVLRRELVWDAQELLFKWKRCMSESMKRWQTLPKLPKGRGGSTISGEFLLKRMSLLLTPFGWHHGPPTSVRSNGRKNPFQC